VPELTPHRILSSHGLKPGTPQLLDAAENVTVTPWRRSA